MTSEKRDLISEFLLRTTRDLPSVQDYLQNLLPEAVIDVQEICAGVPPSGNKRVQRLGEILVEDGRVSHEQLEAELQKQKPIGAQLVEAGLVQGEHVEAALSKQRQQKDFFEKRARGDVTTSIRVSSFKLDSLVNLVGELVTVQERLSQVSSTVREAQEQNLAEILRGYDLNGISEEVSRLTNGLRDNALSIRMLPIETTFSKFKRLVHDLAANLGKEIDLMVEGAETEIDKTVIDKLDEPLMHIIRNCADHGIEFPEARRAAGKSSRGRILLSAEHAGGNVIIRIHDDGGGLNKGRILAKAIERNLIPAQATLTEKEIFGLIFHPGFSTAAEVTEVSGRGVGMDVVKKAIEDLRGTVDVCSHPGQGTRIDITLPLTLAIIDGLLVRIGPQDFIFPLPLVEECIELTREHSRTFGNKRLADVRGELIPYLILREHFHIPGQRFEREQIVIIRTKETRIGMVVDGVLGEHKTVIKPLGRMYKKFPEFSGASILGDGSIALILDVPKIIQTAGQDEHGAGCRDEGPISSVPRKHPTRAI
jgi:two-component system chemotaxis sensor kinase CheA